jgi:hypothetical protein
MNPDESFSIVRHVWLMFVIITFANAAIWWSRGRAEIAQNPALKWGYRRLIIGFLIFGNIPWLILGAAFELLPSPFSGPLLIAFAVTLVVYWIAGLYWLFFGGGAENLAAHPGSLRAPEQLARDPRAIKVVVLSIIGATFVMLLVMGLSVFMFGLPPQPIRR